MEESGRRIALVNILSGADVEESQLTGGDYIHKECPRLKGLGKLIYSSLHEFHEGILVLLDRIPITYHQDDGPCGPTR